jgi:hypothetical protein
VASFARRAHSAADGVDTTPRRSSTILYDGPALAQVTASYALSDHWSFSVIGAVNAGGRRTDFGSLPQVASALATVRLYY